MTTEPQNLPNRHNAPKIDWTPEIHLLSSVFCILSSAHLYICRGLSTNQPFYAKQTQFPKKSNERNSI